MHNRRVPRYERSYTTTLTYGTIMQPDSLLGLWSIVVIVSTFDHRHFNEVHNQPD